MAVRRLPTLVLAAALLATALAPPRSAPATHDLSSRAEVLVRRVLRTDPARGTRPGIAILRDGRTLAHRSTTGSFVPASLLKLATTSAALLRFGPEHRFRTSVMGAAPRDGVVRSNIYLVGAGDPTFASKAYRARYLTRRKGMASGESLFATPSPFVEQLAARIKRAGVTHITGNLGFVDSLFDRARTQRGWKASYTSRSNGGIQVGALSALPVNEGFGDLRRRTVARDPAAEAGRLLLAALRREGVRVDGTVRRGRVPSGASEIAAVLSPPVGQIVAWTNRWSVNYPAEILLKGLGAAFGDGGTTASGRAVVRSTLAAWGVSVRGLRIEDGSGLSLLNRMTPGSVAQILKRMLAEPGPAGDAMRASLAVAAEPGALLYRMGDGDARGNLRGKTAMLDGVRGMAGWVTGADGEPFVYVALFNRARSEMALTATLDLLGEGLADLR